MNTLSEIQLRQLYEMAKSHESININDDLIRECYSIAAVFNYELSEREVVYILENLSDLPNE
jgi:hypothetical protein